MTEAGKRLLQFGNIQGAWPPEDAIAAIEDEAIAAERARIVAGVEGLPVFAFSLYDDGTDNRLTIGKAAVLRIIEAEAVVAHGSHCDAEYRRDSCVCADAAERSDR